VAHYAERGPRRRRVRLRAPILETSWWIVTLPTDETGRIVVEAGQRDEQSDRLGAIVLVGYDPAAGLFTFAHSWGTSWGADGFGMMSRETAEALLDFSSAWAVAPADR
jgi:hypothetical protein